MNNIFFDDSFFDNLHFVIITKPINYDGYFIFSSKDLLAQSVEENFGDQNIFASFSINELFQMKYSLEHNHKILEDQDLVFNTKNFSFEFVNTNSNKSISLIPLQHSPKQTLSFIDAVLTKAANLMYNDVIFSTEVSL